jgi:hypothetical protein
MALMLVMKFSITLSACAISISARNMLITLWQRSAAAGILQNPVHRALSK